jgi:hypothetical protein
MDYDLSPDKVLTLRILLDRLYRSSEQCRSALSQVREGKMTKEAYARVLHEQITAQRAWEERHHNYDLMSD